MLTLAAAFLFTAALQDAPAEEAAPGQEVAATESSEDRVDWGEVVCKRMKNDADTGSRLRRPKKQEVCRTRMEWREIEDSKEEFKRDIDGQPGTGAPKPDGFGG